MNYAYTGRSSEGAVSGMLDGTNAVAVADALMARGVTPLTISQAASAPRAEQQGSFAETLQRWMQPRVQPVDLLLFSRQLHTLLKAGVPILRALAGLQESAPNPRMKQILQQVRQSLGSGIDLSMSFAQQGRVFDGFYVALVHVGEMTGRLEEVFLRLFHHIEFEIYMGQQIKAALRYPMFVLAAMVAGVSVINVMVIPAFESVFKGFGAELPLATRMLMATSSFTIEYGWLLLMVVAAGIWLLRRWIATPVGRLIWDRTKLRLPLAGKIIRKGLLARFARSFALSLKSGVPVEQALSVVAQTVENAHIAQKIEGMRESVEHGESILRAAAAAGVFTPIVLQMIAVGEETGAIDELMDEVAGLYTNEVQYELKTLGQQIEPILIVVLGVLVLVLALGVFLPVWDLGRVGLKH
ncbi:MAG TPA: type II secretion system F family protein [Caldimonas sp.]